MNLGLGMPVESWMAAFPRRGSVLGTGAATTGGRRHTGGCCLPAPESALRTGAAAAGERRGTGRRRTGRSSAYPHDGATAPRPTVSQRQRGKKEGSCCLPVPETALRTSAAGAGKRWGTGQQRTGLWRTGERRGDGTAAPLRNSTTKGKKRKGCRDMRIV